MNISIKTITLLSTFVFFAFTATENNTIVENEYNLHNLKESHPPREITIIKAKNLSHGKNLLENGVLITYKNRYAKAVNISGDFTDWKPIKMTRGKYGVWYYFLNYMEPGKSARYKFIVDGIWSYDPVNNEKEDDNAGSYVSMIRSFQDREDNMLTYRFLGPGFIEFRIYNPNAKFISLVGDFNNWNPENDILIKNENGVWNIRKRLSPGMYRYNYIIDGQWSIDLFNDKTASSDTGEICSLINIEK